MRQGRVSWWDIPTSPRTPLFLCLRGLFPVLSRPLPAAEALGGSPQALSQCPGTYLVLTIPPPLWHQLTGTVLPAKSHLRPGLAAPGSCWHACSRYQVLGLDCTDSLAPDSPPQDAVSLPIYFPYPLCPPAARAYLHALLTGTGKKKKNNQEIISCLPLCAPLGLLGKVHFLHMCRKLNLLCF